MAVAMGMTQPMVARIESGDRCETKGHLATLSALIKIHNNGNFEEFLKLRIISEIEK